MPLSEVVKQIVGAHWPTILLTAVLGRLVYNKYGNKLNLIPGPYLAGFTDLWRFLDCLVATPHVTHIDLHRRLNSDFVRIGPRTVSISNPSLIPKVYGLNSGFTKTEFYTLHMLSYHKQFTPSLFTTLDEDYHAKYKRPIANAYSMSTLVDFEPMIDSTSALFMSRLDEYCASGGTCDFGKWLQMYAFDVIGEIVFSRKLGFLETRSDIDGIIADIKTKVFLGGSVGQIPAVDRFLTKNPLYLSLAPTHPVVKFTVDRMNERMSSGPSQEDVNRDILARCYEAQKKNPDLVTDRIIRMYNIDNVLAGSDTTGISLRSIFYHLMKNPRSLALAREEIDTADRNGHLDEFVTWQQSNKMTYMQACIKEALRLHPAVGLLLERYVPKGGIEMGGHFFPEGTIVGINPWVTARDKAVYGEDADYFVPERWLNATPETLSGMDRSNLAFGHGARSCIGKNISLLEIAKLVPQILRHYELSFPKPGLEWKIRGGWFVGQEGFEVRLKRRNK